ncbi:MAG: DoxX family protein [Anaerolineae bacterium]|nr:DoxX family protein [Candidatus Roseilinea sp.]MDW8448529.1 DoxX family protein [Anaerolineae bacterium]
MASNERAELLQRNFDRIDLRITRWMARHGITLLRIGLGVVFFWFGVIKLIPGLSPAQDLAARTISTLTFGLVPPSISVPALAIWECLIGLGLISGKFMRVTIFLLLVQMLGTLTPLFLFPGETWTIFPVAPTLEGQYIIKNIVLVSAALVIGATVRGGYVLAEPGDCR